MNKTYKYDQSHYNVRVTGIGYFSILILIYCLYHFIRTPGTLYLAAILICCYVIFETFITCANPNKVTITDKQIIFEDPRHKDVYNWNQIRSFRCSALPNRREIYLRINSDNFELFKGRYWVFCLYFEDGEELYQFLLDKQIDINPDYIRAKGRAAAKEKQKNKDSKTQKKK